MSDVASQFAAGVSQAMDALGVPATYTCCGTGASLAVNVALAKPDYQVAEASGMMLSAEAWELLIAADATAAEPVVGDSVVVSAGGIDTTYTVLLPDGSRYCWMWADRFQVRRRMYVKITGRTPTP